MKVIQLKIRILITVFLFCGISCGEKREEKTINYIVPENLKNNKEVKLYIQNMNETVNDFSNTLAEINEVLGNYRGKNIAELSDNEKEKLLNVTGKVIVKVSNINTKCNTFEKTKDYFKKNLSTEDFFSLNNIIDTFSSNIKTMNYEYSKIIYNPMLQ